MAAGGARAAAPSAGRVCRVCGVERRHCGGRPLQPHARAPPGAAPLLSAVHCCRLLADPLPACQVRDDSGPCLAGETQAVVVCIGGDVNGVRRALAGLRQPSLGCGSNPEHVPHRGLRFER